jgi:DNA-binding NtrC family response regulator
MRIFVVDDERILRVTISDDLRDEGHEVEEFSNPISALVKLKGTRPDLIITDLSMPEMDGMEFLKKVKALDSDIHVIMITAFSTVSTAVEAMKHGAFDYIEKPFNSEKLALIIERIKTFRKIHKENEDLKEILERKFDFSSFVGTGEKIEEIFSLIKIISNKDTSVLLQGDTGTGKELLTNIIHYNSHRKDKPFVKVSCAVLSREIFESELFGHVKGAFTGAVEDKIGRFELANSGTLYLDDIDDVPLDLQVKLLRALEEREIERLGDNKTIKIDLRLIASTKKNLKQMVEEGSFREDLYYRINVFPIRIPALRERSDDIEPLIKHFIKYYTGCKTIHLEDEAKEILRSYPFPGNVRELRNLSERLSLIISDDVVVASDIPSEIRFPSTKQLELSYANKGLNDIMEDLEIRVLGDALSKSHGNKAKAAEMLRLPVSTFKSKLQKFGIQETE